MKKKFFFLISILQLGYASDNFYYQNNKKVYLIPYNSSLRSSSNINYYKNKKGIILDITDKIIVKLKGDISIDNLLSKFNVIVKKKLGKNLYLLETSNKNYTIAIVNQLNKDDDVEYAQPDFIKQRFRR